MQPSEISWNEQARNKIVEDADRVLREAVLDLASTMSGHESDDVYSALYARLKDRFIDFEPGPDIRKFATAIANSEVDNVESSSGSSPSLEVNDG